MNIDEEIQLIDHDVCIAGMVLGPSKCKAMSSAKGQDPEGFSNASTGQPGPR